MPSHIAKMKINSISLVPKRHRGQHFLIDKNILKKIIDAAAIQPDETIVEIGAGTGILTSELATRAKKVIAVELDKELIPILQKTLIEHSHATIIQDDCLDVSNKRYGRTDGSYAVVANIPYNITSRLIRKFLEEPPRPSRMILLIQREVAERMRETPPRMNLLALSVQYYADIELLFRVSRNCFSPKPAVESAVVRIVPKSKKHFFVEEKRFFALIGATFKGKRKRIVSTLADATKKQKKEIEELLRCKNISLNARPQELSLEQWIELTLQLTMMN